MTQHLRETEVRRLAEVTEVSDAAMAKAARVLVGLAAAVLAQSGELAFLGGGWVQNHLIFTVPNGGQDADG